MEGEKGKRERREPGEKGKRERKEPGEKGVLKSRRAKTWLRVVLHRGPTQGPRRVTVGGGQLP